MLRSKVIISAKQHNPQISRIIQKINQYPQVKQIFADLKNINES